MTAAGAERLRDRLRTLIAMEDTRNSELTVKVVGYQWKWKYEYQGKGVNAIIMREGYKAYKKNGINMVEASRQLETNDAYGWGA